MITHKIEGIILKAFDFQDYDKIINVLTEHSGIITLILKGANRPKQKKLNKALPLMQAEFVYKEGRSDMKNCIESSVLDYRLQLRQTLPIMEAAFDMINAILKTQLQGMESPSLYHLLKAYLDKLPLMKDPTSLSMSFQLKLLRHEGLLPENLTCVDCKCPLESCTIFNGEAFCSLHTPLLGVSFNQEESIILQILNHCSTFSQIANIQIDKSFKTKILQLLNNTG